MDKQGKSTTYTEYEWFYDTKHALTRGIVRVEGTVRKMIDGNYVALKNDHSGRKLGSNIFRSLASAQGRAEDMRRAKIKSLEKQIDKLEELSFAETE